MVVKIFLIDNLHKSIYLNTFKVRILTIDKNAKKAQQKEVSACNA
jgi:hypothetical protein